MAARAAPTLPLDADFPRLKSLIIERTGHFYYQDKDDLLWERVRRRLKATGARNAAQFIDLLNAPGTGPVEWARLEAEITIGETFFFRYAEQFAALRGTILPEIIERKRPERRLRIWSAGCATGAEPYSLAILVRQLLGEDLPNWRLGIIGTDINESFLETARRAQFGQWALRSLPQEERAQYFLPVEREQWQLRPEFRSLVRFEKHNLLSLLDGSSPLQFTEFDLILCRNVLIYFHPDTVNRVVGALRDCLLDDAWMLLGHAEPNPSFSAIMQAVNLPGTVAYRRREGVAQPAPIPIEAAAVQEAPAWQPKLPPQARPSTVKDRSEQKPAPSSPVTPARPPARPSGAWPSLLADVRRRADAGDLTGADAICLEALRQEPLNAALHFYHGLISQALGRPPEAEKAFRRCLYLDKSFAMAHYHLGLLLLADGRSAPGRRTLANAARIAGTMPDGHPLPEGDGLTAGDLRQLVRVHLQAADPAGRRA
ncbi:CheR family methyltransferase [Microvirga subterranea]|uniref:protein-glutamate O-methyltransferase n=1 Tax=Microvirga subterranea TaxID=186651 RepID=A0A370HVT2_9HYPH|nr:protein-glutamate O-methyltransferase CheR [Microvirga subterranea]RDI62616.1 chemotaxis protein methyltransferase CheR [Microvirga subterranea]